MFQPFSLADRRAQGWFRPDFKLDKYYSRAPRRLGCAVRRAPQGQLRLRLRVARRSQSPPSLQGPEIPGRRRRRAPTVGPRRRISTANLTCARYSRPRASRRASPHCVGDRSTPRPSPNKCGSTSDAGRRLGPAAARGHARRRLERLARSAPRRPVDNGWSQGFCGLGWWPSGSRPRRGLAGADYSCQSSERVTPFRRSPRSTAPTRSSSTS